MATLEELKARLDQMSWEEVHEGCKGHKLIQGAKTKADLVSWFESYKDSPEHEAIVCKAVGLLTEKEKKQRERNDAAQDRKESLKLNRAMVVVAVLSLAVAVLILMRGCD